MKKRNLLLMAGVVALSGIVATGCGKGNKESEKSSGTELNLATTAEDGTAKADPVTAADTAKYTPNPAADLAKYNAAFFTNPDNKGSEASPFKYAQTNTGLRYVILNEGTGRRPSATSEVTVHYVGVLPDGTQFDSSVDRGEPASFPLQAVIPGWTEGLQLMEEGGVAIFYLPHEIAYGENGIPGVIPPASPLIFWVQLLQTN